MGTHTEFGSTFRNKNVLVAGGTGMVGQQLVLQLLKHGARVRVASMDDRRRVHPDADFFCLDLTDIRNCYKVCGNMDYAFNLLCTKGSPALANKFPLKYFEPMTFYNANLLKAAYDSGLEGFLLTSTIGVYPLAEIFKEETALTAMPSPNDFFPGFAKMHAEAHVRAYIQEGIWPNISIVRPAGIYGPYDNFDGKNAQVIPSLIKKAIEASVTGKPFIAWGDGSQIRDFIHSSDVARGMLCAAERGAGRAINLGSGTGITIRELTQVIINNVHPQPDIIWDTTQPTGDPKRIMDTTLAKSLGFEPAISLQDGIRQTIEWYLANRNDNRLRYDVFNENKPRP